MWWLAFYRWRLESGNVWCCGCIRLITPSNNRNRFKSKQRDKKQASAQSSRHITQTCEHWYYEDEPGEYTEQKPKLNKTRFGTWRCDNKKFLENCNPHIENVKHLEQKQAPGTFAF